MPAEAHPVNDHLAGVTDLLVLLSPGLGTAPPASLQLPEAVEVRALTAPVPRPRERHAVLLAARDLLDLRRAVTALPNVGSVLTVIAWFEQEVGVLPTVRARLAWPTMQELVSCRPRHSHVAATFASAAPARQVLAEMARSVAADQGPRAAWPVLGARRDEPWLWPPGDPAATIAAPARLFDPSVDYPPDLVLTHEPEKAPPEFSAQPHPVLGRPPLVGGGLAPFGWQELEALRPDEAESVLGQAGPSSLGAIDERVLNPIGFDRSPTGRAVRLEAAGGSALRAVSKSCPAVEIDAEQGLSDTTVPLLRHLPGLELTWDGGPGPQHYARLVGELAVTGVPLLSRQTPRWAELLLPGELVRALEAPVDLTDRLRREEHSVRLRRAGLRSFALDPWRRTMAQRHGQQTAPPPRVSVLLVTRRPEMVPFALRQVGRQHDADLEVVLATHGFEADPGVVADFRNEFGTPLTTLSAEPTLLFGEVLNLAAERAEGDVLLKMDDDDWYGPDFVSDLLLARSYSGADVVGCPPEFTFVEPLWLTTRRYDETEAFRPVVAGGTMLIDRGTFRALGGFRHTRKYVDATLLSAVANAGGSIYRTHGLGYVLRRGAHGHTWDPGLGYFVTRKRAPEQWRGFRPSTLLEHSPEDLPAAADDERVGP